MTEDWLIASCLEVERAARAAQRAIDPVISSLGWACEARGSGLSVTEIVEGLIARGGPQTRRGAADALRGYERAMTHFRSTLIRGLVEGEGLSVAEVARRLSISRQMAARLYARAEPREAASTVP